MSRAVEESQHSPGALATKLIALCLAIALAGCAAIRLVSDYDEPTEQGASALQRDISAFFVKMQSASVAERRFDANLAFYQKAVVDLNALQGRAEGIRRNSLTQQQLQLVEDNLALVVLTHKGCLEDDPNTPENEGRTITPAQRNAIRENGVDISLGCRIDYGATQELADRRGQVLNPALVGNLRGQFDQALGAVIAFEVFKKRGQQYPQTK
jgi:hypothetical protein